MYKILVGIPAMFIPNFADKDGIIHDYECDYSTDIWCDFAVCYNQKENYYFFEFETMLGFKENDGCKNWIKTCLEKFKLYMDKNNLDTTKELSMYEVFTEGVDINTHFENIETAYAYLKMLVYGFNGTGMMSVEKER